MLNKRTVIVPIIIGALFLAMARRSSILLVPGTISWIITIIAGSRCFSRNVHALWGMLAALFLFAQAAILIVMLQVCELDFELAGGDMWRNRGVLAVIGMFIIYLASLVNYFGQGVKPQPINSPEPSAVHAASSATRSTSQDGGGSVHDR